jgi:hydroxyneurosporene synthase CrtC
MVLSTALVNFSIYATSAASATSIRSVTANVIPGNSSKFVQREGLMLTPQPSEDGMRIDPMPNTFEWWYLQGTFSDGSHAEFAFFPKPWMDNSGPLDPYFAVSITSPNGTVFLDAVHVSTDQFSAARNQANITTGNNWMRGDLKTYHVHFQTSRGLGADLVFNREAPSARGGGGSGIVYFDPSLTRYVGWFIALPSAKVEGTLTYNAQTHHVQGEGYHDHNWGTVSFNQVLDRWFWTTGHFGNYTLDAGLQVTTSYYNHQQLPAFYLARGNQVLINEMNHFTVHGSGNLTAPGGHDYPKTMNFHWQNGTDTVNLVFTNPKIVQAGSPVVRTNATIFGNPEYLRLSGNGTLNVNIAGKNETFSTPIVVEINYGH